MVTQRLAANTAFAADAFTPYDPSPPPPPTPAAPGFVVSRPPPEKAEEAGDRAWHAAEGRIYKDKAPAPAPRSVAAADAASASSAAAEATGKRADKANARLSAAMEAASARAAVPYPTRSPNPVTWNRRRPPPTRRTCPPRSTWAEQGWTSTRPAQ